MKHLTLTSKRIPVKAVSTPSDPYAFKKNAIDSILDAIGYND